MSNPPPSFLESTRNKIKQHGWKRLLLAVSGGLDSICLAHFFVTHKADLGIEWLGIAHVHHGLREDSADLDAKLVERFAKKHNAPFFLKKLDGAALKKAEGSLEENARKGRYEALNQIISEAYGTTSNIVVITAHHAGDQAETMYMRLRRGVTLSGLQGIQEFRTGEPSIYRPLLSITRKELLDYAKAHNLQWREDESNADTKFTRNLIRHQFLPHLEKSIPGSEQQLCRIASLTKPAYEKVIEVADHVFSPLVISKNASSINPELENPLEVKGCTKVLILDTHKARVTLSNGMDEIFRLWLDYQGFRFPIDTFKGKAALNDVRPLSYRSRFILKKRHIIWICEKTPSTTL